MAASAKSGRSGSKARLRPGGRGKTTAAAGLFSPLRVAWLLSLLLVAAGAVAYFLAYQQGGPRTGHGLTLALPSGLQGAGGAVSLATAPTPAEATPTAEPLEINPAAPDSAADSDHGEATTEPSLEPPAAEPEATPARIPHVALVITGLGMAREVTEQALAQLPTTVALSFSPYAPEVGEWITRARTKGHEVLLDLPMEPLTFPNDNPGPLALMTHLEPAENLERLNRILGLGQGYVGVVAIMGSRFLTAEPQLEPVLKELARRGLLFLDNRSSDDSRVVGLASRMGLVHAVSDRTLDDAPPSRELIESRLLQIERLAFSQGTSIALGRPYPATLQLVARWAEGLETRGLALVPLSQVISEGHSP